MENWIDDVGALQPTYIAFFPSIANQIYTDFNAHMMGLIKNKKLSFLQAQQQTHRKFRYILGRRLLYLTCGSAPVSKDVIDFLSSCFYVAVSEGYGCTEVKMTSGIC